MTRLRIEVDLQLCQGHGVCSEECPEVFEVVDMETGYSKVRVRQPVPDATLLDKVRDAARFCPNQTIRLVEID